MTSRLRVRLTFTLTETFDDGLNFRGWLPDPKLRLFVAVNSDLRVELWINPDYYSLSAFERDFSDNDDIRVGTVMADVIVNNVSDALSRFVVDHANDTAKERTTAPTDLCADFEALGLKVQEAALTVVNRFLSYARIVKGQFWLPHLTFHADNMAGFTTSTRACVSVDGAEWIRWNPSCMGTIRITVRNRGNRLLRQSDWVQAQAFVESSSRPPLHLELLSGAEALEHEQLPRSALTEAVAALEVATLQFLKSNCPALTATLIADLDVKSYEALYSKLGLRGTLAILLPLVLDPMELPRDVLRRTVKAVETRNTVVHGGNRKLSTEEVAPMVANIRRTIELLHELIDHAGTA